VAVGERIDTVCEDVTLIIERAEASFQILKEETYKYNRFFIEIV